MRPSRARVFVIVERWLWWATFETARASGSGPLSAYKRAQKATAKLHA